jgi:hypothetical protein
LRGITNAAEVDLWEYRKEAPDQSAWDAYRRIGYSLIHHKFVTSDIWLNALVSGVPLDRRKNLAGDQEIGPFGVAVGWRHTSPVWYKQAAIFAARVDDPNSPEEYRSESYRTRAEASMKNYREWKEAAIPTAEEVALHWLGQDKSTKEEYEHPVPIAIQTTIQDPMDLWINELIKRYPDMADQLEPDVIPELPWAIVLPYSLADIDSSLFLHFEPKFHIETVRISPGTVKYGLIDRLTLNTHKMVGFGVMAYVEGLYKTKLVIQSPDSDQIHRIRFYRLIFAWITLHIMNLLPDKQPEIQLQTAHDITERPNRPTGRGQKWKSQVEEFLGWYANHKPGFTDKQIAEDSNVPLDTIKGWRRECGLGKRSMTN